MVSQSDSEHGKYKKGRMEIRGGQPIVFHENAESAEIAEPPKNLQELANTLVDTFKAYRDAVKTLVSGRYAEIRELLPDHLKHSSNTTVICCKDGVIVRSDAGTEGTTKVRSGAIDESLSNLVPKFSDGVVHLPVNKESFDPGAQGIELEMVKVNLETCESQPIIRSRLVIVGSPTLPEGMTIPPPPTRAPALISLTNELQVMMGGVVVPADQSNAGNVDRSRRFVAKGSMPLKVGWQALEVYPLLEANYWKPEYAALWAETDILAALARLKITDGNYAAIDPNLSARKRFQGLLNEFSLLLDGAEEPAHQFLKEHPELLSPATVATWSKLPLGKHVTDFIFREPPADYELVEIESPLRQLFRKDGQPRQELVHAIDQILDWRVFLEDNLGGVQKDLGLAGISSNPRSLVVIGRSAALSPDNRRKLTTLEGQVPRLRVLTYDDVIQNARAVAENLFGPMSIVGQNIDIYYFPVDRKGEKTG